MLKRILLSLLVIPVLGGLMYFYFNAKSKNTQRFEVLDAIPNSFTWILQINDVNKTLKNFSGGETIIDWLAKNPDNLESHNLIAQIKRYVQTNNDFFNKIAGQKAAIAFFKEEGNSNFVIYAESKLSKSDFFEWIDGKYNQEESSSLKIYSATVAQTKLFFSYKNGIVILTKSIALLEKSLANFESNEKWKNQKSFKEIWLALNSNADAYLIANSKTISANIPNYIAINPFESVGELSSNFIVNALTINKDFFSGIGVANISDNLFFSALKNQSPIELKSILNLPIGIAKFQLFAFSKPQEFIKNTFLDSSFFYKNSALTKSFNDWFLAENINEIAKVEYRNSNFYVLQKSNDDWSWKPDSSYSTKDSNVFKIKFNSVMFKENSIKYSFDSIHYFSVFKNQIVLAENKSSLLVYLKSLYNEEVLGNKEFSDVLENINSIKANYLILEKNKFVLDDHLRTANQSWTNKKYFSAFSLSMNEKVFEYSFINSNNVNPKVFPDLIFSETSENFPINNCIYYKDSEKEFIVTKGSNNLIEAFDFNGKLIWQYKISGEILGKINIIKFKEDKNILVFNTAEKLYFINSKGQSIKGFPMKFESKATAEISVMSNTLKDEYRITVPCENNKIYNYDGTGKVLFDWNYPIFENSIENKVIAFKENGERFYATTDVKNNFILQSRKGKRVSSSDTIFRYGSSIKKIELGENSKPIYFELDSTGLLKSFCGNKENNYAIETGLNGVGEFLPILQKNQTHFAVKVGSVSYLLNNKGKIVSKNVGSKSLKENYSKTENYLVWNDGKNNLLISGNKVVKSFDLTSPQKHFIVEKVDKQLLMFYSLDKKLVGRILN
ncbi:MAG: hypothetical protein ACK48W_01410 [Bacteroidota bacterium]